MKTMYIKCRDIYTEIALWPEVCGPQTTVGLATGPAANHWSKMSVVSLRWHSPSPGPNRTKTPRTYVKPCLTLAGGEVYRTFGINPKPAFVLL